MVRMFSFSALWLTVVVAVGLPTASRTDSTRRVSSCNIDSHIVRLQCDVGQISMVSVRYGDSDLCGTNIEVLNYCGCTEEGNLDFFRDSCDGQQSCEMNIKAIAEKDICLRNYRHVEVQYNCGDSDVITSLVCSDTFVHLQCAPNKEIFIKTAEWGRRNQTTCSFELNANETETFPCCSIVSSIVKQRCQGTQNCSLPAVGSRFGNPCSKNVHTYLKVTHSCVDNATACDSGDPPPDCGRPAAPHTTHRVFTCREVGTIVRLQCDLGQISVVSVRYGTRGDMCNSIQPQEFCGCTEEANQEFFKKCNGQRFCETTMQNLIFKDRCLFNYRHIEVYYNCGHSQVLTTSVVCQLSYIQLQCEQNKGIFIRSAEWGRGDPDTCLSGVDPTRTCKKDAERKMAQECNFKQTCTLSADQPTFGEVCHPKATRFLTVTHSCAYFILACEDEPYTLSCEGGKVIAIVGADFGRSDTTTCSDGTTPDQVQNVDCSSRDTTKRTLLDSVRSKKEFNGTAGVAHFDDNCPGTRKYLTVAYNCFHS